MFYSKDNYDFFSYTFKQIPGDTFDLNDSEIKDMAKVTIKYSSTEYTVNKHEPLLSFVETVCYVGGLMGMYLGISFLRIYDIIVDTTLNTYKTFKLKHKDFINRF